MEETLSEQEIRVLGSLIEKERTTPEYYPLTLNALVNACNQKSNRSPVVLYDHAAVAKTVDGLRWKGWVVVVDEAGSRTEKYRHAFLEKSGLAEGEMAVLAELMLRGPQTAGEVRGRANRMHRIESLDEAAGILRSLAERNPAWSVRFPRRPGRKEHRYAHLLGGPVEMKEEVPVRARSSAPPAADRVGELEEALTALRERVEDLERKLGEFRAQFE
ncbi:MAG: YceH family protein [Candidatus Eisenbacteria bacterium]